MTEKNYGKSKIIIPGNNMWRQAILNMVKRGDIKVEDGNKMLRRLK